MLPAPTAAHHLRQEGPVRAPHPARSRISPPAGRHPGRGRRDRRRGRAEQPRPSPCRHLGNPDRELVHRPEHAGVRVELQLPVGRDHNGSARMVGSATDNSHVYLPSRGSADDQGQPGQRAGQTSTTCPARRGPRIRSWSTTSSRSYEVRGEFQAPSARGTWPAFWLTGATSWPPESDILEFKGDSRNWFNTYKNAAGAWSSTIVSVSNPASLAPVPGLDHQGQRHRRGHPLLPGRRLEGPAPRRELRRQAHVDDHQPADGGLLGRARPDRRHLLHRPQRVSGPVASLIFRTDTHIDSNKCNMRVSVRNRCEKAGRCEGNEDYSGRWRASRSPAGE